MKCSEDWVFSEVLSGCSHHQFGHTSIFITNLASYTGVHMFSQRFPKTFKHDQFSSSSRYEKEALLKTGSILLIT